MTQVPGNSVLEENRNRQARWKFFNRRSKTGNTKSDSQPHFGNFKGLTMVNPDMHTYGWSRNHNVQETQRLDLWHTVPTQILQVQIYSRQITRVKSSWKHDSCLVNIDCYGLLAITSQDICLPIVVLQFGSTIKIRGHWWEGIERNTKIVNNKPTAMVQTWSEK